MTNRFLENLVLMLYNSYSIFVAKSKKKTIEFEFKKQINVVRCIQKSNSNEKYLPH
jgi:hypothetical protein